MTQGHDRSCMVDTFLLDRRPVSPVANRSDLVRSLRSALDGGAGFTAAKLGRSEQAMLLYPTLLERCRLERQRVALNTNVRFHCALQLDSGSERQLLASCVDRTACIDCVIDRGAAVRASQPRHL